MNSLSHKIRLKPTKAQEAYFRRACGVARFVYNWGLAEWKKQREAGGKPRANVLKTEFNKAYPSLFPWVSETHRDCHSQPFANLQKAFKRFFEKKTKHPKFKSKHGSKDAFYVANDKFTPDRKSVRLPKIGRVRMAEELRFQGKTMSAVVSREADKWFISISVEVFTEVFKRDRIADGTVGVDLGIKTAVVTSDGQEFQAPKPLARLLKKLKRLARSLSRKQKGSNNRAKAGLILAGLHARIANVRKDFWHKVTTKLCSENQAVGIEDLNIAGMTKNRSLARALNDVGLGVFRPLLAYKTQRYGTGLQIHSRWLPSSKTCSSCGEIKDSLSLSERTFRCDCGLSLDRDLNAALNLKPTTPGLGVSYACGPEGSGHRRETKAKPRRVEAGIKVRT